MAEFFLATWALTSRAYLSAVRLTKSNTRLDLTATDYPNSRCSLQRNPKVGILSKTSTNKWWFVQFPPVEMLLPRYSFPYGDKFSAVATIWLLVNAVIAVC